MQEYGSIGEGFRQEERERFDEIQEKRPHICIVCPLRKRPVQGWTVSGIISRIWIAFGMEQNRPAFRANAEQNKSAGTSKHLCGFVCFRNRLGSQSGPEVQACIFWAKRLRITATCARVAFPLGARVVAEVPLTSPCALAHWMASTA